MPFFLVTNGYYCCRFNSDLAHKSYVFVDEG